MASTPDEIGFWTKAATWAAGSAATLAAIVWGDMRLRVSGVENGLKEKADKVEMDRQRNNVNDLFNKLDEHNLLVSTKFDNMTTLIHELHRQTMDKLDKKQDKRR